MASKTSVQLFCLPYAGASASVYGKWQRQLPRWIEVCPVELPGHGRNIAEPLVQTVAEMVERLRKGIQRSLRGPFALFGHSMGAVLAFELAHAYESAGEPAPVAVFASGSDAPSQRDARRYERLQSDDEILSELERLAGTPAAVLADAELMELALPILRADFAACAAYRGGPERRITRPINVLAGENDAVAPERLSAWREHTASEFALHVFPGGHFFIHEHSKDVLACITRSLEALLAEKAAAMPASAHAGGRRVEGESRHG